MIQPFQYSDALFPVPRRVFGKLLEPFSLGHALLLTQIGNSMADAAERDPELWEAIEAAWLCSMPWPQAVRVSRHRPPTRVRLWSRWCFLRVALSERWGMEQITGLLAYMAEHCRCPKLLGARRGPPTGLPVWMSIKTMAQRELRLSESEALNASPSALAWGLAGVAVSSGAGRFPTEDDDDLQARAAAMRAEFAASNN